MLNIQLHAKAEFVQKIFGDSRYTAAYRRLMAEIIDEALDAGDILTAQELCELYGATMAPATVMDVVSEVLDLASEMEIILDEEEIPFYEELLADSVEIDLSEIDDACVAVSNSGNVIPLFRQAVA